MYYVLWGISWKYIEFMDFVLTPRPQFMFDMFFAIILMFSTCFSYIYSIFLGVGLGSAWGQQVYVLLTPFARGGRREGFSKRLWAQCSLAGIGERGLRYPTEGEIPCRRRRHRRRKTDRRRRICIFIIYSGNLEFFNSKVLICHPYLLVYW